MQLTINGETMELPDSIRTVGDLLIHFQLQERIAIVELNRQVLERGKSGDTPLADGDILEIVHFVGGG